MVWCVPCAGTAMGAISVRATIYITSKVLPMENLTLITLLFSPISIIYNTGRTFTIALLLPGPLALILSKVLGAHEESALQLIYVDLNRKL